MTMTSNDIHVTTSPDIVGRVPPQLLREIKKCVEAWAYVERHYDGPAVTKFIQLGDVEQLRQALVLYGNGSQAFPTGVVDNARS